MTITLQDIKKMGEQDLSKKLAELQEEIRNIHFKAEGSKSKNVKEQSTIKKTIARILTQMNDIKSKVNKKK